MDNFWIVPLRHSVSDFSVTILRTGLLINKFLRKTDYNSSDVGRFSISEILYNSYLLCTF